MLQAFKYHLGKKNPSQLELRSKKMRNSPFKQRFNTFSRKTAFLHFQKSLSPLIKTHSARGRLNHNTNNDKFRNQKSPLRPRNQYYENDHYFVDQFKLRKPTDLTPNQLKSGPSDPSTDNSLNSRRKEWKSQLKKFSNILRRNQFQQQPQAPIFLKKAKTDDRIYQKNQFEEDHYGFLFQFQKSLGFQQKHSKHVKEYPRQREGPQQKQIIVTITGDENTHKFKQNLHKNKKAILEKEQKLNVQLTEYGDIRFLEQELYRTYNKFQKGRNVILKSIEIESTPNKVNDLTMDPTF